MSDMFSEGYVGYTSKTTEERYRGHLKEVNSARCKNYPIYNNMKKYGDDIVVSTILIGSEDYCLDIESKLRPSPKIGWNIQAGGNKGCDPSCFTEEVRKKISDKGKGRVFSDEHKSRISESNKGKSMSEDSRIKMSAVRKGVKRNPESSARHSATLRLKPWSQHRARLDMWSRASEFYDCYLENPLLGANKLSQILGISESNITTILKHFRNGFIPSESAHWIEFKENYEKENANGNSQPV